MDASVKELTGVAADPLARVAQALFREMGVDGVYARTALYEDVLNRLSMFISRQREPQAEVLRFPPVMSRRQLERSGYLKSFPNLLGCVCALHGTEQAIRAAADRHDAGGDWTESLSPADLVLRRSADRGRRTRCGEPPPVDCDRWVHVARRTALD